MKMFILYLCPNTKTKTKTAPLDRTYTLMGRLEKMADQIILKPPEYENIGLIPVHPVDAGIAFLHPVDTEIAPIPVHPLDTTADPIRLVGWVLLILYYSFIFHDCCTLLCILLVFLTILNKG